MECVEARSGNFEVGIRDCRHGVSGESWHLIPRSTHVDGTGFLRVALAMTKALHLKHVARIRACRGVPVMFVLDRFVSCEVLVWLRGGHAGDVTQEVEKRVWRVALRRH